MITRPSQAVRVRPIDDACRINGGNHDRPLRLPQMGMHLRCPAKIADTPQRRAFAAGVSLRSPDIRGGRPLRHTYHKSGVLQTNTMDLPGTHKNRLSGSLSITGLPGQFWFPIGAFYVAGLSDGEKVKMV